MLKLIKDPVFGNAYLSNIEADILQMPVFNRLHYLMQNGLAHRVFPSNTTSRFEHSIGVMHLSGEIYCRSLANAWPNTRETFLKSAWKTLLAPPDSDQHKMDSIDPLLKEGARLLQTVEAILGAEFLNHHPGLGIRSETPGLMAGNALILQAVRLAGLLHDVGHFPCSHLFEDAIRLLRCHGMPDGLDANLAGINDAVRALTNNANPFGLHEAAGFLISRAIFFKISHNLKIGDSFTRAVIDRLLTATLRIMGQYRHFAPNGIIHSLSEILAGDLDADRLDFILRDGRRTGLVDASGDVDRILKMMCLVKTDTGFRFCPATQTLNDVQECLLDRLRLYQYLYSHHRVWRLENAMKTAIRILLRDPGPSRETLLSLFTDLAALGGDLEDGRVDERLSNISRKTDHWLTDLISTMLMPLQHPDEESQIKELFSGEKALTSLWKREFEYRDFLIGAAGIWLSKDKKLLKRIKGLLELMLTKTAHSRTLDPERNLKKLIPLVDTPEKREPHTLAWLGGLVVRLILTLDEPLLVCQHRIPHIVICPTRNHPGVKNLKLVDIKSKNRECRPFADLSVGMRYLERMCERGIAMYVFMPKESDPEKIKTQLAHSLLSHLHLVCKKVRI